MKYLNIVFSIDIQIYLDSSFLRIPISPNIN